MQPDQDRTYTIAATGPGGTATANVSVGVQPETIERELPEVILIADPEIIGVERPGTRSWFTLNADSCSS